LEEETSFYLLLKLKNLSKVSGVFLVVFSMLLIGQQGSGQLFSTGFPLAGEVCRRYANGKKNLQ